MIRKLKVLELEASLTGTKKDKSRLNSSQIWKKDMLFKIERKPQLLTIEL